MLLLALRFRAAFVPLKLLLTMVVPIGFALDYELFLFGRCYELHQAGYSDAEAIEEAVRATGPVISAAGVIMCLAFLGMLVQSSIPFLCQMGFCMVFGILVDTFVVRTLLVPAVFGLGGRANWWPAPAPAPRLPLLWQQA